MSLKLMYITNRTDVALVAERAGIDRIWIDLETLGKEARQAGMNTVKSNHSIDDIRKVAPLLSKSQLMVRVNPWNNNSEDEINEVIEAGAEIVMLPMWKSVEEVRHFIKSVGKRAKKVLLLETKEAENVLDDVLLLPGIDEIHIGLNDLHLSYGLTFMFELLANGTVERICNKIAASGIPYGFGGVGRLGDGLLKADSIIVEHYRLKSSAVILSRTFCNVDEYHNISDIEKVLTENVLALRRFERTIIDDYDIDSFEKNRIDTICQVNQIVEIINKRNK